MKLNQVVILAVLLIAALSRKGIVITQSTSYDTFDCLANNGFEFARVLAFNNGGTIQSYLSLTMQSAKAAGMTVDVYYIPCRGRTAN